MTKFHVRKWENDRHKFESWIFLSADSKENEITMNKLKFKIILQKICLK